MNCIICKAEIPEGKLLCEKCDSRMNCIECLYDESHDLKCADCTRKRKRTMQKHYWQNICLLQEKQTAKGIKTYGQTIEENIGMSALERLTYLEEELIDALMYIEHLKVAVEHLERGEKV